VSSKVYSSIKYLLVPGIAYFFYWAVWFEMGIWQKTFQDAWTASTQNWIMLIALSILEVTVVIKQKRTRKTVSATTPSNEELNPWNVPPKQRVENRDSVKYFMRGSAETWGNRIGGTLESVGKTRIHRHVFLKIKRMCFGLCFIIYAAMALMSLNSPYYLILFVITAYAFLENLLWARHHQWVRRNKDEQKQT